jgi:hypothetical protein
MKLVLMVGLLAAGFFLVMLGFLEAGRRLGARQVARDGEGAKSSTVDAAVFGLMGLLIAFTFSGAAGRFDARRQLVVQEANDIGTAWLRLDLLPASEQSSLREKFRQYVASRLAVYRRLPDIQAARTELARSTALQSDIWTQAVSACKESTTTPAAAMLLPALNQMFDIATARTMAAQMHPPALIYAMLFLVMLAGSSLAGYGMATAKARNWFHILVFLTVNVLAIYIILDFEFPRFGLIQLGGFDQVLVDLQQNLKP